MVKHIIIWKLKDEIEDKEARKAEIKSKLEALEGMIPGLVKMNIITNGFESSTGDLIMDSTFEDNEALKGYQKNLFHVVIADEYVRPYVASRASFDYEV